MPRKIGLKPAEQSRPKVRPASYWSVSQQALADRQHAFNRVDARVYLIANASSAFSLLRCIEFGGAVIDQDLHNAAFELCVELRDPGAASIAVLASTSAQIREADNVVWRLVDMVSAQIFQTALSD